MARIHLCGCGARMRVPARLFATEVKLYDRFKEPLKMNFNCSLEYLLSFNVGTSVSTPHSNVWLCRIWIWDLLFMWRGPSEETVVTYLNCLVQLSGIIEDAWGHQCHDEFFQQTTELWLQCTDQVLCTYAEELIAGREQKNKQKTNNINCMVLCWTST